MPINRRKKGVTNVKTDQNAVMWCFRQGFRIYPITKDNINYQIVIQKGAKGKPITSKRYYSLDVIDKNVALTYDNLYRKYNKQM